jgi:hypothetical protein
MNPSVEGGNTRTAQTWIGITLSGVAGLLLLFDSMGKLLRVAPAVEASVQLGYPDGVTQPIGMILLICVVTYLIPRTAILGAVLLTGYMGGAIATHVRVGSPLPTHVLFPVYVAILVWLGVYFRDPRVRYVVRSLLRAETAQLETRAGGHP